MKTVLFIGDSITDCHRNRNGHPANMGAGYASFIAGRLGILYPGMYKFLNHGNSGYRVIDLYAYLKEDVLRWKPDYVSILIGVNDVWHGTNGVSAQKYEKLYDLMLQEIRSALPEVKLILMEPFVCSGTYTDEELIWFKEEVSLRADAVRRIADRHSIPVVELQKGLDKLVQTAPPARWLMDGVHPTPQFHQYIADQWIQVFTEDVLSEQKGNRS